MSAASIQARILRDLRRCVEQGGELSADWLVDGIAVSVSTSRGATFVSALIGPVIDGAIDAARASYPMLLELGFGLEIEPDTDHVFLTSRIESSDRLEALVDAVLICAGCGRRVVDAVAVSTANRPFGHATRTRLLA